MHNLKELAELINPEGIADKRIIAAQKSFWEYCKLINPKFFKEDRTYLHELCDTLQGVFEGTLINEKTGEPYKKLMINLPPRHGKSYTMTLFNQWALGKDNETRVLTVSYNDNLAGRFARNVRDGIDATKLDKSRIIFSDVFPSARIKHGDASYQQWSLEDQYISFVATGFGGTLTGFGATIGIIDDPIKSHVEAFNDNFLDEQWSWYTDTFLSRVEEDAGGIQVIIMTRWSTKDLCGKLLESEEAEDWLVFKRQACQDEENEVMLCPSVLSFKVYSKRRKLTSQAIADANYQQEPVDLKGRLYSGFREYEDIPRDEKGAPMFETILAYTDTADEGTDDLCSIVAGLYQGEGYILDVYMTDDPMEITEPETAKQLVENRVDAATIESNNGGRGFARSVERLLWDTYGTRSVAVTWFHQSKNKHSRIMAGSTFVMQHLLYPDGWERRWPRYYGSMNSYQRQKGKNKHDDGPDATTGMAEIIQEREGLGEPEVWWI